MDGTFQIQGSGRYVVLLETAYPSGETRTSNSSSASTALGPWVAPSSFSEILLPWRHKLRFQDVDAEMELGFAGIY